jgi:hypothetical protein
MRHEQGLAHAIFTIKHIRANTDTAKAITILLESFMLTAGITTSPLQDLTEYPYVESVWIQTLRNFLQHTNITISTPSICCPNLLRENHQAHMVILLRKQLTTPQLRFINDSRLWLQVTTIAEITNITGTEILSSAFHGTTDTTSIPLLWHTSRSQLNWPRVPRPDKKAWNLWKKSLHLITAGKTTKLRTSLGGWYNQRPNQRTWLFHRDDSGHFIRQTVAENSFQFYHSGRMTTRDLQVYKLINTPQQQITYTHPITPHQIQLSAITNKTNTQSNISPPNIRVSPNSTTLSASRMCP